MHTAIRFMSCAFFVLPLVLGPAALAQPASTGAAYDHGRAPAIRVAPLRGSVRIDSALDEPSWGAATPATAFTQLDPSEGAPASERSEVRILLGDDALYIGARLYDSEAREIKAPLARRDDEPDCDYFEVSIDSYHDHLTAKQFRVTPAGTLRDDAVGADGSSDDSWDSVWEATARVDAEGWSVEIRIPLAQLRYNPQPDATWGIQIARFIHRKAELDQFAFTPKAEQAGVSRYGHLTGLGKLPLTVTWSWFRMSRRATSASMCRATNRFVPAATTSATRGST